MWRGPLNSTALVTITHRKPKRVSDGTGIQVRVQMINKCRMKMVPREIYKVKGSPSSKGAENSERGNTIAI